MTSVAVLAITWVDADDNYIIERQSKDGNTMTRIKFYLDWLFKDLNGRNGKYVIAEAPNVPLIIFMVFIVLAVVVYPGYFQTFCSFVAYLALGTWSYKEARTGRSRFRKLLGYIGILAVAGALLMRLGF